LSGVAYVASIQPGVFARHHRALRPDAGGIRGAAHVLSCARGPAAPHSVANAQGWFYAGTPEAAVHLADEASASAADFSRYFDRSAPPGAVIAAGTGQAITTAAAAPLKTAGATWQLPWLDAGERRELQRSAVERQVRGQLPDASDADICARVDAALSAASTSGCDATDRSALRHEIGHMLLMRTFWPAPRDASAASPHYGGRARTGSTNSPQF